MKIVVTWNPQTGQCSVEAPGQDPLAIALILSQCVTMYVKAGSDRANGNLVVPAAAIQHKHS